MAEDTFSLGDDAVLNPKEVNDKTQKMIIDSVEEIKKAGEITEKDRAKIQKAQAAPKAKSEAEEILQLSNDLSDFLADKVDINNDDGGLIEKFPSEIDLLDAIAGGGFGIGTFSMIVGAPGSFKSALLAQIIAAGQKKFIGRMLATYHDAEVAMSKQRLMNMGVVNPPVEPYTDVTIENIFKTIEAVCAFKELRELKALPSIVAWDSIANTETAKARTTDDINATIGLKARMLSQLFPRYLPKMKQYKISLIAINQLREKLEMGMFSPPADLQHMGNKEIPGGQAVKFNAFHLLYLKNRGDLKFEQYGFNGIKLEAVFIKNKFFRPNVPVTLLVDFNKGISNFWTNYNFLVDCKKIQAGAWNFLLSIPEKKFRTKDVLELYKTDAKFKTEFDKCVKESIKTEIIDKAAGITTPVGSVAD
jgi:RecA/RadA recombinase